MNPDDHRAPPSGPEEDGEFENLLRSLPVKELPAEWRASVLSAAVLTTKHPLWSKPLTAFLTVSWSAIGVLYFTAPELPPPPPGPPAPPLSFPGTPFPDESYAPWLAGNPSVFSGEFPFLNLHRSTR